jgi:hypothetical protein
MSATGGGRYTEAGNAVMAERRRSHPGHFTSDDPDSKAMPAVPHPMFFENCVF